jgi:hypothetical protein
VTVLSKEPPLLTEPSIVASVSRSLLRPVGAKEDADKVMWITEMERETEKDRDTEATMDGSVMP